MSSIERTSSRGKAYWRSLDELADTPRFREFLHREFPASATEMLNSTERRHFLKIMGASLALAGFGLPGCRRWPQEKIVPFAHRPPGRVPGAVEHFATSMEQAGSVQGLLVTSSDGRPIKIEGNPQHPMSRGATDAHAQASVLELYDPDRSRHVWRIDKEGGQRVQATRAEFEVWAADHFKSLGNARGNGLYVLSESSSSPSLGDMKARLAQRFPRAKWIEYEPINRDNEVAGTTAAYGRPYRPHYAFDRARVIVSLDSDFLFAHAAAIKHSRDFAAGRRADDPARTMNRLYVFESGYSLTGANADHRFAVRTQDVAAVTGRLAAHLVKEAAPSAPAGRERFNEATAETLGVDEVVFEQILDDLERHRGECIVVAGPRQPAAVHALAHLINDHLDNVGRTVHYTALPEAASQEASMKSLAQDLDAGLVDTLVILGGNPAYDAPADLDIAANLGKIRASVHLSSYDNETSRLCTWHVPRAHYLESWGDARTWDGTLGIVQPLILPLFGGMSTVELLAVVTGDKITSGYDIVRRTFAKIRGGSEWERSWRRTLHQGFLAGSAHSPASPRVKRGSATESADKLWAAWTPPAGDGFELVFVPDTKVYDGRFANNGWLQELPDPLTKLTWDNAVLMGPAAAERLRVDTGDMVRVSHRGRQVEAAVCLVPGQHPRSVTLPLGYGRKDAGVVAEGAGFDFYPLRTADAMNFAVGATIEKIGGRYELAQTQDHYPIDSTGGKGTQERLPTILREATIEQYRDQPDFAAHATHVVHRLSLWHEDNLAGAEYAWGMSIDLSACTGCSACVVACQAENNIPVVGKDQVSRGREMHWIRVDRYFKGGDAQNPDGVGMQPVPCMQCENAPCEQVCPVAATTHDKDGLNVMIYNRCVGTRYCSNNCPYKVRRFNYFDYWARDPVREGGALHVKPDYYTKPPGDVNILRQMQFNPEVTVRSRGVMEKCTYCIQRIAAAKIKAKNAWVKLSNAEKRANPRVTVPDGSLTTACAAACPAQAIVFGDLNDPDSEMAALRKHPRTYELLEELNTKPRTTYLARLLNPNPALAPAAGDGEHPG